MNANIPSSPAQVAEEWQARSWPVRVVGVLLTLQAASFVAASLYLLNNQRWQLMLPDAIPIESVLTLPHMGMFSIGLLLIILAGVALISAVAILLMRPLGWLLAMIVQALTLAGCLDLYFTREPVTVYPFMLFSILLVLYLNSADVRLVLYTRQRSRNRSRYP